MKSIEFKRYSVLIIVTLLISGIYLIWCNQVNEAGFPLDDAWIHQTFARNLAEYKQWEFNPGEKAAGSTSPMWTMILAFGYLLHIRPLIWTISMGIIGLIGTGILCELMWRRFQKIPPKKNLPVFGLLIISEWHLVWAALSGMETILHILIIYWIFFLLLSENPPWLLAGFLTGMLVWIRPDGLTILGPVLFLAIWNQKTIKDKAVSIISILVALLIPIAAYMIFNYNLNGMIWPNTLYAKQAEYAVLRDQSVFLRYGQLFTQLFVGVGITLLPGFIYEVIRVFRNKNKWGIATFLWLAGFIGIYAVQLPVTYQHARYLIPVIPMYLLIGFAGYFDLYSLLVHGKPVLKLLGKSWLYIIIAIQIGFCTLGAKSYAKDVAIINSEMVKTANWIANNLPVDATIATHDIGAVGYFTENKLIDLAGLINPDVIPIMRNEGELLEYIHSRDVEYLVTFPDWYPDLVLHGNRIYTTDSSFSPQAGGENMAVYRMQ